MNAFSYIIKMGAIGWFAMQLLLGCVSTGKVSKPQMPLLDDQIDQFEVSLVLKKDPPKKVAILPFENLTDKREAFEIVRRSFYNHFASKKYQDAELHQVDYLLRKNGLYANQSFLKAAPAELGKLLGVDGLIYGRITGFDRVFLGAYSQVAVELEAKMIWVPDSSVLWRAKHRATKHAGGVPIDPIGMIPLVIRAALNLREIELLRTAEDLSRLMMATLPEPAIGKVLQAPAIKLFAHDSQGEWKKAGETIRVALVGDSGLLATFDVAHRRAGIPMQEESPGVYSGYYKILPGDDVTKGMVVGHLADGQGNQTDWVDPFNLINIDTIPPAKPHALEAIGRHQLILLSWSHAQDEDVHKYQILRSESPKTGYVEIERTEHRTYHDRNLVNGTSYYYKISAMDPAGNESEPTTYVRRMPLKPGPTEVGGPIGIDMVWYAGSSPYILKNTVVVLNGAVLTIEPGGVVQSAGPGIVVKGRLLAQGKKDNLIQFVGITGKNQSAIWNGITFDNTHDTDSKVTFCKIKHAKAALTAISSSPEIADNIITQNETGIFIQEFAKPHIKRNTIIDNRGAGIQCERSDPSIMENHIADNDGNGILCRNAEPVIQYNNFVNNGPFALLFESDANVKLAALDNWWGSKDTDAIKDVIKGNINYKNILDAPYPEGKSITAIPELSETQVAQLTEAALKNMKKGNPEGAVNKLQQIIKAQPKNHKIWYLLGTLFSRSGNKPEAIKHFERAIEIDPKKIAYHLNLGIASQETNPGKAMAAWRKVLEIDPDNEQAKTFLEIYAESPAQ